MQELNIIVQKRGKNMAQVYVRTSYPKKIIPAGFSPPTGRVGEAKLPGGQNDGIPEGHLGKNN